MNKTTDINAIIATAIIKNLSEMSISDLSDLNSAIMERQFDSQTAARIATAINAHLLAEPAKCAAYLELETEKRFAAKVGA